MPSIVYGILGLAFLVRGLGLGRAARRAFILTLLVLPTVIIAAREAIRACPARSVRARTRSARRSGRWSGARYFRAPLRIATGSILALSRALGETAPLLLVGALTYVSFNPTLLGDFTALPVQIFQYISRPQEEFRVAAGRSSSCS